MVNGKNTNTPTFDEMLQDLGFKESKEMIYDKTVTEVETYTYDRRMFVRYYLDYNTQMPIVKIWVTTNEIDNLLDTIYLTLKNNEWVEM